MQRRSLLLAALTGLPMLAKAQDQSPRPATLQVWKDPQCGCCTDWVEHLRQNGFKVEVFESGNVAVRKRLGMPERYGSCHTGWIDGYVVEGHVPAREIRRLMAERPRALGLAVPGMPVGSPGMDGPVYGARRDAYGVLLVQQDGRSSVYQHYAGSSAGGLKPTSGDAAAQTMSEGEVRRVDIRTGKLTLRHGEIKNLDMPPMTMVFQVSDPAMLSAVKVGDKVRFRAEKIDGVYTVTRIEPAP
ncbi:copper-binding protein [Hydrogenophaga sp.]|uniref:copper-binding protein n=1 Tax=Hydrogenophaga sp. TaxID=1904254 RepID=UPI0034507EE6|nr:copper-binding protein [Hydrogenophaga sp.]